MSKQEENPEDFIRLVGSEVVNDPRFKTSRHRTKFEVKKIENSKNPEKVLRRCIELSIEAGMHECKKAIGFQTNLASVYSARCLNMICGSPSGN